MTFQKLHSFNNEINRTECPSCRTKSKFSKNFLKKNINKSKLTATSYSSRKSPEFMNNELVRCNKCELVYSISIPKEISLFDNYANCEYVSSIEDDYAAETYIHYLFKNIPKLKEKNFSNVLEIGSGSSAFLNHLSKYNFENLIGIEPSKKAKNSLVNISNKIKILSKYKPEEYEENSLDLFCSFMTLEHLLDPKGTLNEALRILKPGGTLAIAIHNVDSLINKIMGKYSPIIDLEHLQLFSKKSIKNLLVDINFRNIKITNYKNKYPLAYWLKLLPVKIFKSINYDSKGKRKFLANIPISFKAGNIFITANKSINHNNH